MSFIQTSIIVFFLLLACLIGIGLFRSIMNSSKQGVKFRENLLARVQSVRMHKMLQADTADTFVLATGRTKSIRNFVDMSFAAVDIQLEWSGSGEQEHAVDASSGQALVRVNPRFFRPAEVDRLIGDASKASESLDWSPSTTLEELCDMMVTEDIRRNESGRSW